MKQFLLLTFIIIISHSILIPVKPNRPRCLSQYLISSSSTSIKIIINFPKLQNIQSGQHFTVTFRNTQTDEVKSQIIQPGSKYGKQQHLSQSVIYQICMILKSDRDIQPLIDYNAQSLYNHQHDKIQVPENLLTKSDMKAAYISASYLAKIIQQYSQQHKYRIKNENNSFLQTQKLNKKLTILSIFQLFTVIAAGIYQFITLKNYLNSKQYI